MLSGVASGACARPAPAARTQRLPTRAYAQAGADNLIVKFNLSYRCDFGQHMRLIGTGERLGEWDLQRAVPMTWTDGDVWTVELKLPAAGGPVELEYKYVVCGGDGEGAAWKPGSNFMLSMPAGRSASVKVRDAWDESSREVQIEVLQPAAKKTRRSKAASDAKGSEALDAITFAADRALDQLDAAVSMSADLQGSVDDPASPELLAADRVVAAAAQRAAVMVKALDAAANSKLITERRADA